MPPIGDVNGSLVIQQSAIAIRAGKSDQYLKCFLILNFYIRYQCQFYQIQIQLDLYLSVDLLIRLIQLLR